MPNTLLTTTPSFLRTLCNLRWVAIVGQAVTVLVNLPFADAVLSLAADGDAPPLTAERKDALRAAINLEGMPPGEYRWAMSFAPR